jgi:hypothetical protein
LVAGSARRVPAQAGRRQARDRIVLARPHRDYSQLGAGHDRRGAVNEDRPTATDGRLTVASEEADGEQEDRGCGDD